MRKTTNLTLLATALFAAMAFTACSDDDNDNSNKKPGMPDGGGDVLVLTFEDKDFKGGIDNYWTGLIDNPEYNGPLLYGENAASYGFCDTGNTGLSYDGFIDSGYGASFSSGGYAISNYWSETYDGFSFDRQLCVSTTKNPGPGADGSDNFMIVNSWRSVLEDANSGYMATKPIYTDGEFEPQYVYATNTSYVLNSLHNGDSYSTPATANTWFWLYAEGVKADGEKAYTYIDLCEGTDIEQEWVKFDLTPLGKVKELYFFVMGSDDLCGDFGLNTPSYAAVDNLAIKK